MEISKPYKGKGKENLKRCLLPLKGICIIIYFFGF